MMDESVFVDAMLNDLTTVEQFYNNPEEFLKETQISEEVRAALLADDLDTLHELGMDRELMSAALSGRHLSGCWCGF